MIKRKCKAFTKWWALFCVKKHNEGNHFVHKSRIIRGEDFRLRKFERTCVRFCSVLNTNLSGSRIQKGGDFTGNGWYGCNFSGVDYSGITMEMEQFEHCVMGNAAFRRVRLLEIQAKDCNYAGSLWENAEFRECVFEQCNFRKVRFSDGMMDRTTFRNCILDGIFFQETRLSGVLFENCLIREWREPDTENCIFRNCTFENC